MPASMPLGEYTRFYLTLPSTVRFLDIAIFFSADPENTVVPVCGCPFFIFCTFKVKQHVFNKENLESTDSHKEGSYTCSSSPLETEVFMIVTQGEPWWRDGSVSLSGRSPPTSVWACAHFFLVNMNYYCVHSFVPCFFSLTILWSNVSIPTTAQYLYSGQTIIHLVDKL